jgi:hypothetical protein
MGALIFASERARERVPAIARWLARQPWCDRVLENEALGEVGLAPRDALAIAFAMAKSESTNRWGIPGCGAVAADPFMKSDAPGRGQHGGLGRFETNPFLLISAPGLLPGPHERPSCAVDLAPTAMDFLGHDASGMDGRTLLQPA